MNNKPLEILPKNVKEVRAWLLDRGGLLVWKSVNLSNAGAAWTTPAIDHDGKPYGKPNWQTADKPERRITDAADVVVLAPKEVKRFHVALRRGAQGFMIKLTDTSSARVRRAVATAGAGAWYEFDYNTQEAVIYLPDRVVPLSEWKD